MIARKLVGVVGICLWISVTALSASLSVSQEHAPTEEQCKADQALWGSSYAETSYNEAETRHIQDGTPNRTDIAQLAIPQLSQRMNEMYQCMNIVALDPYQETGDFYHAVIADRYFGFLKRHGLINEMTKEDAEGKR